jgi:hypothetical protein
MPNLRCPGRTNLPPVVKHRFSDVLEKPRPLQAFKPLQEFEALLPLRNLKLLK